MNRVIGVDPDTVAHGIAIYENEKLVELKMMTLVDIIKYCRDEYVTKWVVEEVTKNKAVYNRNIQRGKSVEENARINMKIAMDVGKCQQSMVELVRVLEAYNQRIVLIPPSKDNWSKDAVRFKRMTGWRGKSNVDTRAASYFGFLGL